LAHVDKYLSYLFIRRYPLNFNEYRKIDFQIADNFCEEALIELKDTHPSNWVVKHHDLYESISIKPEGRPSITNQHYGGLKYDYIGKFHSIYEQKVYKENILKEKLQYGAIVYFIERMNIDKIDELLDYQEYCDKDKPIFIEMLKGAFVRFKEAGECKGCNNSCKGFAFIEDLLLFLCGYFFGNCQCLLFCKALEKIVLLQFLALALACAKF